MPPDLDRRTYDLLRLIDRHGPIGSIQLFELMQLYGYEIKDRTIRLTLSELDELGLTEKVPGRGRRLTASGREELERGDINSRLEEVRARIATLSSRVSYDPIEDAGVLVGSAAFLSETDVDDAIAIVDRLADLPLGPLRLAIEESSDDEPGDVRIIAASSITLDGVLLARGVNARITHAGIIEYDPIESADEDDGVLERGGRIRRYVDVLNGEGSSIDVLSLLIEAGRTEIRPCIEANERGLVVGDSREFPINRFEEARDLAIATRQSLGGAIEFQRPRDDARLPSKTAPWAFGSITYVGPGELLMTVLSEYDLTDSWETLYGTVERSDLSVASPAGPSNRGEWTANL